MSDAAQPRARIVIIGAGINGLSAGWSAWQASGEGQAEITVLEAAAKVGGKAQTRQGDGWLFEEGPTGFLSGDETLERLLTLAGLEAIPAQRRAARRYVVHGGRAREIQTHPLAFAKSGILSLGGLLRLAREPWIPRGHNPDESIWEFARRRLGSQVADRLIAPMVLGVFAGDAKKLSLASAFPRMAELEQEYGSLIRAMRLLKRKGGTNGGPAGPGAELHSFAGGMQSLPNALAERAPFAVVCGAQVESITRDSTGREWRIQVAGEAEARSADQLVLSCEAPAAARLLRTVVPGVATELAGLSLPPVAVVGLSYSSRAPFPTGFGALIPRGQGFRILGCLFDTQLFDGRSPAGRVLVRCMIGGACEPQLALQSPESLSAMAAEDLARLFKISEVPEPLQCVRHAAAIPQYEIGHEARVQRIDSALEQDRARGAPLFLAGCHAGGIAFGKSAKEGWRVGALAGESALRWAREASNPCAGRGQNAHTPAAEVQSSDSGTSKSS